MKYVLRTCWLLLVSSYLILLNLTSHSQEFIENNAPIIFWITGVCSLSGIILILGLGYLWFKTQFATKLWKLFWLVALLFVYYMIGPAIFYVIAFELKKTVAK
jgi:biotin transporter BioY